MFWNASLSSAERLLAPDWNATRAPLAEMYGKDESPLAPAPPRPGARLTSLVVLATRSRTKMLVKASSAAGARLSASDWKTT